VYFKGKSCTDHAVSILLQTASLHRCHQELDLGLEYFATVKQGVSTGIHCCCTSYTQVA